MAFCCSYVIHFGSFGKRGFADSLEEALAIADALARVYSGVSIRTEQGKVVKTYR